MKGIFIPDEFFELNLTHTEIMVLSFYKYFTEKGKMKCCKQPNESIYTKLHISEKTFKKVKKHLKELGYIRTDGGIRVYYLGVGNDVKETEITETKPVNETVEEVDEVDESVEEKVEKEIVKQESTENEEVDETDNKIDNKTDNKTDIVMEKSNVERIIDTFGDFYKTPDKLKYFYDKKQEWVDKINQADYKELVVSTCASQIKDVINKKFGYPEVEAIPNQKKKEVKSEVEGCFM